SWARRRLTFSAGGSRMARLGCVEGWGRGPPVLPPNRSRPPPTRSRAMRRIAPIARVMLVLLAALALATAFASAAEQPSIEKFLKIRTPASPVPLPDGSLLAIDRPDGIFQLYRFVPGVAAGGGEPSLAPGSAKAT